MSDFIGQFFNHSQKPCEKKVEKTEIKPKQEEVVVKIEVQKVVEVKTEEPKKEVVTNDGKDEKIKVEEVPKKVYSQEVIAKAVQLKEVLPQYGLEFLMETVDSAGNVAIEDLMINLL